jgi:ubiquinone/menaquinone biosynthesis C-methylase UbiE
MDFLKDDLEAIEVEAFKKGKFAFYNYIFIGEVNNDGCKLESSKGLSNLIEEGDMGYQINWCDLSRDYYITNEIKSLTGKLKRKLKRKTRVLDIGCGKSETLLTVYKSKVRIEYHGIDLNQKDIIKTIDKIKTSEPYYLYVHNVNAGLPFVDEYFDVVLMLDIIEHMPTLKDGEKLLKEALRVADPEARIYLTTPNKDNADEGKEFVCKRSHDHEYTRKQILNIFKKNKLEVIHEFCSWLSDKNYKKIVKKGDKFAKKLYEGRVGSNVAKLETVSNFYPEYAKELFYVLKKC